MNMKKITKILLVATVFILSLTGCAGKTNFESKLAGAWYPEGSKEAAFILYDDGTCEMDGEYGTWSVVNKNQLKLADFYGRVEIATIISVKNDCLTLEVEDNQIQFWKNSKTANDK